MWIAICIGTPPSGPRIVLLLTEEYSLQAGGVTSPVFLIGRLIVFPLLGDRWVCGGCRLPTIHAATSAPIELEEVELSGRRDRFGSPAHA